MHMLSHSQNFINNKELIKDLMNFISEKQTRTVIEIGPGKGIITDALLEKYNHIIAIEADQFLFENLKQRYENKNITLICANFLSHPLPHKPFDIVSNIPFNITANIIRKITEDHSQLSEAYLIIQKEAAQKYVGMPHSESSLISNILKVRYRVEILKEISKNNFTPRPKFDAVFLTLRKRNENIFNNYVVEIKFRDFMSYLFSRSKPILRDALKKIFSNTQTSIILRENKLNQSINIKQVSFETWLSIFKSYLTYAPEDIKRKVAGTYKNLLKEQSKLQKNNRSRKY